MSVCPEVSGANIRKCHQAPLRSSPINICNGFSSKKPRFFRLVVRFFRLAILSTSQKALKNRAVFNGFNRLFNTFDLRKSSFNKSFQQKVEKTGVPDANLQNLTNSVENSLFHIKATKQYHV